jgi:hypothetical protein
LKSRQSNVPQARRGTNANDTNVDSFVTPLLTFNPPARFYFVFGKPIDTSDLAINDREACQRVYEQVRGLCLGQDVFIILLGLRTPGHYNIQQPGPSICRCVALSYTSPGRTGSTWCCALACNALRACRFARTWLHPLITYFARERRTHTRICCHGWRLRRPGAASGRLLRLSPSLITATLRCCILLRNGDAVPIL